MRYISPHSTSHCSHVSFHRRSGRRAHLRSCARATWHHKKPSLRKLFQPLQTRVTLYWLEATVSRVYHQGFSQYFTSFSMLSIALCDFPMPWRAPQVRLDKDHISAMPYEADKRRNPALEACRRICDERCDNAPIVRHSYDCGSASTCSLSRSI